MAAALILRTFGLLSTVFFVCARRNDTTFDVQPFRVDLMPELPHLKILSHNTQLPAKPLYPAADIEFGIELDLFALFQFTSPIEGQTIRFVHHKSREQDAIPLLLLHGWPGSFQEFLPVIKPLTRLWTNPTGQRVSFNIVAPSLPGFIFSSPPPQNWSSADNARLFNTLMTDVLGYSTYALHGTDRCPRGALEVCAVPRPDTEEIAANNITLSDIAKTVEQRTMDYRARVMGYVVQQTSKVQLTLIPSSIGLALQDNPVGQSAWIGGNIQLWSDPRAGTPPSAITHETLLTMVSLYYLIKTFQSPVWIYAQNPNTFSSDYVKPPTDAPMLIRVHKFDLMLWPMKYVQQVGNLVLYKGCY
ncbi:Alpha/Beta hydrolase protein [Mycena crocata]|nr:Alpha/Beta hydrolase protein [Mycena crocata]